MQNFLLYSQQFDGASWASTGCSTSVTGSVSDPFGGSGAYIITEDSSAGSHGIAQQVSLTSNKVYTFSCYARSGQRSWIYLSTDSNNKYAWFDLSNGVIGTHSNIINYTIDNIGSSWYRVSISYTKGSGTEIDIYSCNADNSISYSGINLQTAIYIWGAQIVQANWSGDYIQSTSSIVGATTPPYNMVGTYQNYILYSENFNNDYWIKKRCSITSGSVANPVNNQMTADAIVETNASDGSTTHYFYTPNFTTVAGVVYTLSWYVKSGTRTWCAIKIDNGYAYFSLVGNGSFTGLTSAYNATIVPMNNGWYRLSVTSVVSTSSTIAFLFATASGTTTLYTANDGDIALYAYGAQLTRTNYATDYTKTTSSEIALPIQKLTTVDGQNLILGSTTFASSGGWFTANLSITNNTIDTLDPFGGSSASVLTETVNTVTTHRIYIFPITPTALGPYTASVCLKAGVRTKAYLQSSASYSMVVDLVAGTISNIIGCNSTSIKDVGNGWWLVSYTYTYTSSTTSGAWYLYTYTTGASYQGAIGTKALYVYGPQLVQANHFGEYFLPTTTASINLYLPNINKKNPSNLVLWSEDQSNIIWNKNTGVSAFGNTLEVTDPSGGNAATKIVYNGTDINSGSFKINQTTSLFSGKVGTKYTFGIWIKLSSGTRTLRMYDNFSQTYYSFTANTNWKFYYLTSGTSVNATSALIFSIYDGLGTQAVPFTMYTWQARMNRGSLLSEYIKTTSSSVGASEVVHLTNQTY